MTQARENVASAEAGSASENTAVSLNKNHRGSRHPEGAFVCSIGLGEMVGIGAREN